MRSHRRRLRLVEVNGDVLSDLNSVAIISAARAARRRGKVDGRVKGEVVGGGEDLAGP